MRLLFMGTPDFASAVLEKLIAEGFEIVAAFTRADKPKGRKQELCAPPVKELALAHNIPVHQPESLKNGAAEVIASYAPDAIVVAAYGRILPKEVLDIPRLGCVNVHASILPRHRGASPIQSAILCGDKVTGVTTMLMNEGLDTGDILEIAQTDIGENETAGELFDRLAVMGADLVCHTLRELEKGVLVPQKQNDADATYAAMISKEAARIDFSKSTDEICNLVRGMNPWPVAHTRLGGKVFKVYSAKTTGDRTDMAPGCVVCSEKCMKVATGDGVVELCEVQAEGGRRMTAAQFLAGHSVPEGTVLGE